MSTAWSRRRMLGATFGLAGAWGIGALAARGDGAAIAGVAATTTTLIVVQDGRYAASRRHAEALAPRAARTLEARSDLARQWYGGLRAVAARTPLSFAGLTTWSDFLVMRGCAAECGLREAAHELVRDVDGTGRTLVRWRIGAARS
jgi:hypothetical protein